MKKKDEKAKEKVQKKLNPKQFGFGALVMVMGVITMIFSRDTVKTDSDNSDEETRDTSYRDNGYIVDDDDFDMDL